MKPNTTPGEPSGGESSNVAVTGPVSDSAWPVRPLARQNGVSYTAATFSSVPCGTRAFSAARSAGRSGLKSIRPANTGGMATITRLAFTIRREDSTRTPVRPCTIFLTGERSTTRLPSRLCSSWAICCEPPTKRDSCAPSRVLKLRSNVPSVRSLPDEAM